MVSYDPSCPRTFRIAKSTRERKKNCDKAIDGDLQSPKLGPERGSATCRVWDFTQITELQWVQLQNRAKGLPALTGRLRGHKHVPRRHAQRCWQLPLAPPSWLWPLQTFPPIRQVPQALNVSGQATRARPPSEISNSEHCRQDSRGELHPKRK